MQLDPHQVSNIKRKDRQIQLKQPQKEELVSRVGKVNKRTQELIQLDPYQVPNNKGKDRQIQQSSDKMNWRQAELATLSHSKKLETLLPKLNWIYDQLT